MKKIIKLLIGLCVGLTMLLAIQTTVFAAVSLKIISEPTSVTVQSGETATVRVLAEGTGLTYKWYFKNAGSSKFSLTKTFTSNTYTLTMSESNTGRSVYCVVSDAKGKTVTSKTVSLNIRKPLNITAQPTSVTVKKGAKATVKVTATGTGLTYQWYYKDAGSSIYKLSSVTGSSYSVTMTDARSGRLVYCVVTDDWGNSVRSHSVSINMKSLKVVSQPTSVIVKNGERAAVKFTVEGTDLTYKWYYKNAGDSSYTCDETAVGNTYSATMSDEVSGRFVYCVVTDCYNNSLTSDTAYLLSSSMLGPTITEQPQSQIGSVGDTVTFSVAADGATVHYQWQCSTDGVTWNNLGVTSSTCCVPVEQEDFGNLYRCYLWDDYGYDCVSDTVKLLDETALILSQPQNWIGCEGGTAFFEVKALDTVTSYQWQFSTNNGGKWVDSSVTTAAYSTTATASKNGQLFRCIVKDAQGRTQVSDTVQLNITDTFYIASQPTTVPVNFGEKITYTIQAGGTNVKFQWQGSEDGTTWKNISSTTAKASQTLRKDNLGNYYRCIVTNSNGKTLTSDIVQLKWNHTGFFAYNGKRYYAMEDGTLAAGLQNINGDWYYFPEAGVMRTGLRTIDGKIYYFTGKGSAAKGFTYVPELYGTAYFDENGVAATGLTNIDGHTYFFYDSGVMGWGITQVGKQELFFDQTTGIQTFGLVQVGLNDYMYFEKGKSKAYTGLKKIDGKLYYFAETGYNQGVTQGYKQVINDKTYYFDPITKQAVSGLVETGDNLNYFGKDYTMVKSDFATIGKNKYLFDSKGAMCYGLVTHKSKRYYLDPSTGAAVSGWVELNGAMLYFDPKTYAAKTGLVTINGLKYNFSTGGYLKTGIEKKSSTYYYFTKPGEHKTGFVEVNKKVYYVNSSQKLATGLTKIKGKLYYFNSIGVMQTGCKTVKGKKYYFDPSTGVASTGLKQLSNGYTYYFKGASGTGSGLTKINGSLYALDSSGIVRYGRIKINKKTYYFDPATGKALSGWQSIVCSNKVVRKAYFDPKTFCTVTGLKKIGGKLYYFDSDGWVKTGTHKIKGVTYYFPAGTYDAYTGWIKNKDGTHSYFNGAKGKLIGPGKFKISGKYYTIDAYGRRKGSTPTQPKKANTWGTVSGAKCYYNANGKRVTGLQTIDGKIYYFDKNGKMKTGLQKVGSARYYFSKTGAVSGKVTIKGKQYYFNTSNCKMVTGLKKIDGKLQYYDANGVKSTGWITTSDGKRMYMKSSGLQTGLAKIGSKTYYFNDSGVMLTGVQQITASGKQIICRFSSKGVMMTGLVKQSGAYYYYDTKTGARVTGFKTVSGKEYYFDPATGKAKTGLHNISGMYYYFDKTTAQRKYGLQTVNKKLYCLTKETANSGLAKGLKVVDGKTYFFSTSSGIALSGYRKEGSVMYYFDPTTYASVSTLHRRANGETYLFKAGGGVHKGWKTIESKKYYFYPTTGKMAEGLVSVGDKLYYFDLNKGMVRSTSITVGGITYKFNANGHGVAVGDSALAKMINAGINHFDKGYGSDGNSDDPQKFTCSQLVMALFENVGISLPQRGGRQYYSLANGTYDVEIVESLEQAQPGDIIVFSSPNCGRAETCDFWNEVHHIGVYMGDGKIMESYEIDGDTENNGPMIQKLPSKPISSFIYAIIRVNNLTD